MPKATQKSIVEGEEEEAGLHRTTNPKEAKKHACSLEAALDRMEESIREGVVENIMRITIERFKCTIMEIAPYMEETKVATILKSIKDMSCMALMPQTSDREEKLEAMMPELDIPDQKNTLAQAEQLGDLTQEQKEHLAELFDELEVAHESLARASGTLGRLSWGLNGKQLLVILKASVRPLVQINTLDKFWKDPVLNQQKAELPDDIPQRVRLTMIPDPSVEIIKRESFNSPTRLLAATLAFKLLKKFGDGTKQRNMQELFNVHPKQLALCITGHKYLGGTNRLSRKQRASGEEPSTSSN